MAGDALTFRVAFVVRWLLWSSGLCYLAAGHNGPDGSVCFMEGQHHAGEITG
ncbi:Uncharacterised protein [Klebsiella pneumoniae]|uniref:Uncharacterized protein n=1 Tax=Klebsiella pneumoniae TaxID=573 RepID=A0A2X1RIC0_KLEPN|nr:Uncharacterised protein [Klebsiella pneumoniae]